MPRPRITTFGYRQQRRRTPGFSTPGPLEREVVGRRRPTYGRPLVPDFDPIGRYTLPDFTPPNINTQVAKPAGAPTQPQPQPRPQATETEEEQALKEIESDPMLIKARALAGSRRGEAQAGARSARQNVVTQFGIPELAEKLGFGEDIAKVARENPLSVLAGIRREGERTRTGLEEDLNRANLFFGGHRGLRLGELAQQVLGQEAQARAQAQDRFNEIAGNLLGAERELTDFELDAEAEAFGRALDRIRRRPLAEPGGGGGGGGAGVDDPVPPLLDFGTDVPSRPPVNVVPGLPLVPDGGFTGDPILDEILRDPVAVEEIRRRRGGGFGLRAL